MSAPIILIDDEALICRVFGLALRKLGRLVVTFTDPRAAIAHIASSERPCLVICDYRMPGLTGLEVLEQLPDDLPFLLISGDLLASETAAHRRGVTAFLQKPVRLDELLATVSPLLTH